MVNPQKIKIGPEYIVLAVICVLVIALIVNSLMSAFGIGSKYDTTLASYETVDVTSEYSGYVIRDESFIANTTGGKAVPVVDEGVKVELNGEVARIFNSSDYANYEAEISQIEDDLEYYQSLKTNEDAYAANIPVYNQNILNSVYDYASAVADGDYDSIYTAAKSVREYLTVKQIVMGREIDVSAKIDELNAQKAEISAKNLGQDYTPVTIQNSGYFFSSADGFEGKASFENAEEITCSEIETLLNSTPESGNYIGKIVSNSRWYFVCVMSRTDAQQLTKSDEYNITFRDSSAGTVKMRVDSLNEDTDSNNVAVVFSSRVMNKDIASLRIVKADVCFKTYSGLAVPKSAIRSYYVDKTEYVTDPVSNENVTDENGEYVTEPVTMKVTGENGEEGVQTVQEPVEGVYVKLNNVSKYRRINILYENDEIAIVEYNSNDNTGTYLKLNDEILTEGVSFSNEHIIGGRYFS